MESYAIAILRQAYHPDLSGIERPDFEKCYDGETLDVFANVETARSRVRNLDSSTYCTKSGESGRPEYLIVPVDIADYVISGRYGDGSNYSWDFECDRGDEHCGECPACLAGMIDEDRNYLMDHQC